jgi:hypothetical protein
MANVLSTEKQVAVIGALIERGFWTVSDLVKATA